MISIEKLMQNLTQCKDTNITLPSMNDNETNKFIQKTAIDIRREELEALDNVITQINEANYTMDNELELLQAEPKNNNHGTSNANRVDGMGIVPSKSLIVYTENETAPLPEIILELFANACMDNADWYIYGVKNPESFYKSFLLLTKMDFIIKNKNEKKNEVATFKREMALQYETFYKTLEYRKLRFPHFEMVHNLTGIDNYVEYDAIKYMADYSQVNIIILDIITRKYLDITYTPHTIFNTQNNNTNNTNNTNNNNNNDGFVIIIKYANNTYLPLMNSTTGHKINSSIMKIICQHYERIVIEKYKEPIEQSGNLGVNKIENKIVNSNIEKFEYNLDDIILEDDNLINHLDFKEPGNILNCDTISVFYNNNIASKVDNLDNKYEPIIKTGALTCAIEDMIDIEEQEHTPIIKSLSVEKEKEKPIEKIDNTIKKVVISEATPPSLSVKHLPSNVDNNSVSNDAFRELMANIPMKGKAKQISPKAIKSKPTSSITLETLLNTVSTNSIASNENTTKTITVKSAEDEIKPIGKYNLLELQMLAKLYKVDTRKQGNAGKLINKTKQEMYDEILEKCKK